jgi:hypothetical protein
LSSATATSGDCEDESRCNGSDCCNDGAPATGRCHLHTSHAQSSNGFGAQRVHPHWACDVLDALLAPILERERQFVADLVAHNPRDANPTRLCQRFQPCRDIHPVAENVVLLGNHVAEVHPYTEPNTALFGHLGLTVEHPPLHLNRTTNGIHDTRKFRQEAVAGVLYDPAAVLRDLWIDQLAEVAFGAARASPPRPRPSNASTRRHRRQGLQRDGGQGAWVRPVVKRA